MHLVGRHVVLVLACLLALVASPARADDLGTGGTIHGAVNYPSDHVPPLLVYAIDTATGTGYYVATAADQRTFTMVGLPPGTYHVLARTQGSPVLRAGYTAAVLCGLTVECTDHTLLPVTVTAGAATGGVDVFDWYAPEGAFPAEPAQSIRAGTSRLADTGVSGDHLAVWVASVLTLLTTGLLLRRSSRRLRADRMGGIDA